MDFPGNSRSTPGKDDKPEKKIEKVVTGEVVKRPKSIGRKFKDIFLGGDIKGVFRYLAADVLLPALRNMIVDAGEQGIRRAVYGESAAARRRAAEYRPRTQYNSPVNRLGRDPRDRPGMLPGQPPYYSRSSRHQVGDLILISREEAELVLERLIDIIDKYDVASVADLYDLVGLPSTHVDNKWGWGFLSNVEIRQVREGYLIELPPVEPI